MIKDFNSFVNENTKNYKMEVSMCPTKECQQLYNLLTQYNDSTFENKFQEPIWSAETEPYNNWETEIFITGNYPKTIFSGKIKDCIKFMEKELKKLK